MIVIDEQLLGRNLKSDIKKWYNGKVCFINELRPYSVIKDDALPELLRKQNQPTFVTINLKDFWRKIKADKRFCIVCFSLPDSRIQEIPPVLRVLLQHKNFKMKSKRMGTVIRIAKKNVRYYDFHHKQIRILTL